MTVALAACNATTAPAPAARTEVAPAPIRSDTATASFARTLTLHGLTFDVACANASSTNELRIQARGLEIDNTAIVTSIDGIVTGAEVADLDADGSPEVYVFVQSAGSGSYGSLVAFAANKRKSLSGINLPPVADHPEAGKGYMGHDQFSMSPTQLVQRFPVYRDGDANAAPTGGTREVRYRLTPGEAGWQLRIEQVRSW